MITSETVVKLTSIISVSFFLILIFSDYKPNDSFIIVQANVKKIDYDNKIESFAKEIRTSSDIISHLRSKCSTIYREYREKLCSVENRSQSDIPLHCDDQKSLAKPADGTSWIVDQKRKLAYCLPPKSGCSSSYFIWYALEKNDTSWLWNENKKKIYIYNKVPHLHGNLFDQDFHNDQWKRVINTRHPFERLYSGWKSKMTLTSKGHSEYFINLCKWSKKYERDTDLYGGEKYCLSFEALLTYIADHELSQIERHFKPMSSICNVCEVDFTDASQTKNLGTSVVQMMKDVAIDGDEYMINAFTENKEHFDILEPYKESHTAKEVFQNISRTRPKLIEDLHSKYHWDFELFGYNFDQYTVT